MGISTTALLKIFRRLREGATTPSRQKLLRDAWPGIKQEMYNQDPERLYAAGSWSSKKPDPGDIDLVSYRKPVYGQGYAETSRPVGWGKNRTANGLPIKVDDMFEYPVHMIERGRPVREFVKEMVLMYPKEDVNSSMRQGKDTLKKMMKEGRKRYGRHYKWERLLGAAPLAGALVEEEDDGE